MRTCLDTGSWSGSEPVCEEFGIGMSCDTITQNDIERVLSAYIDEHGCSDASLCPPSIDVNQLYINCLSPGQTRNTYTHATVTVRYARSDMPVGGNTFIAQADIGCSSLTGDWEANVLQSLASSIDQVFKSGSGKEDGNVTMTACSACLSPSLARNLSLMSDQNYHCVGESPNHT